MNGRHHKNTDAVGDPIHRMSKSHPEKIAVVLPAHNEAAHIGAVLRALAAYPVIPIVVDDASGDGTATRAGSHTNVAVVTRTYRGGKEAALKDGLHEALRRGVDAVVFMDADGQHDPADIEKFLTLWRSEHPDVIIGMRNLRSRVMPLSRKVWNRLISLLIGFFAEKIFSDTQCGFRLFSRRAAEKLSFGASGYAFETESIYEMLEQGFEVRVVPIKTIYNKVGKESLFEISRAMHLFYYAVTRGMRCSVKRSFQIFHQVAKPALILLFIFLSFLLFVESYMAATNEPQASRNALSAEYLAAFTWLKKHTEPSAIIMAHWYRGNQIVAFADRRVVSTTKVYPTEATDVAERHRDIAKFFLAGDETKALSVATKYSASYVFVSKDFEAWLCNNISRCDVSLDGRTLSRRAMRQTFAGRMAQGDEFTHFKKVWNSPHIAIYKITDADQSIPHHVRETALFIARSTIEAALNGKTLTPQDFQKLIRARGLDEAFSEKMDVDVSAWSNQRFRASRLGIGGTLLGNIVLAAHATAFDNRFYSLEKSEVEAMQVEVVFMKDDPYPLEPYALKTASIDPFKGYALEYKNNRVIFLPEVFNVHQYHNLAEFLGSLCRKGGFAASCYREPDARVTAFSVEDIIESKDKKTILELAGPLVDALAEYSDTRLMARLGLAARWLLANSDAEGRMTFTINPLDGTESRNFDVIRNALGSQSLAAFYRISGDKNFLESAQKSRNYIVSKREFLRSNYPSEKLPTGILNFLILADLELFDITHNETYKTSAVMWTNMLWSLRSGREDFSLVFFPDGKSAGAEGRRSDPIVRYQALAALAKSMRVTGSSARLKDLELLASMYQKEFQQGRILKEGKLSIAKNAWLVNAFAEMYRLTKKREYADFAFDVADWLLGYQLLGGAGKEGAFTNTPADDDTYYARGTGKTTEALADAYALAKETGDARREKIYAESLRSAFGWLMSLQLTDENSFWVSPSALSRSIGGLRHDVKNPKLWIDSASHFLLGGSMYLKSLK
ncbi:MAG: hypothetical protein A3A28_02830 [Candidatus Sungbacteria bacterium RIFCSPLOWO2_01_FULL_47_32]|uniref:AMMECR1 domain-containing protein n=1 Tax=Candidatus Sungbacteria bacterium RIFCSPHIGHO2_01_FULL_47_32 TaxID=1802264 RepID=A0A1G2K4E1_9BACT|nr:MAG: hypothetical protein A2633_05700 [Candidatus Sungbacteria bacterium RIFCSPHIGHO2_01_FULL_47_32]OGZ99745.1 MAG: hypothetical protein A3D57_02490 [Candidatus Sungbacteria bacterium RIFCSPHIGHO2_02_FULL_46_12]OHA05917.1 MAG: hypothetical protein A3A28_02830 [Candidatus Sungbacteria bacterium RIFCSPLOWO2_01_FULL_47_32]